MQFLKINEAVEQIKNNSLITYSGMQLNRAPMALVYEIVRQKKKNLAIVSAPNPLAADLLIGAGCVKSAKLGFNGFSYEDGFVISPNWRNAVEQGKIEMYETDIFEILQGLKAAALGLKEIEVSGFKNTAYIKINKCKKTKNGIMTKAIKPDFALIHAQVADSEGNVFVDDPLIENLLVKASSKIIVTVEKIAKLKKITIPQEKIASVSVVENGALPTACFRFYDYHLKHIKDYVKYSKQGDFGSYLDKFVFGAKNHDEFVEKIKNE
jgi:glutaconate CoA-transferase subunit A